MLPSGLIHVSGNMPSPRSSVLSKFEVVIEYLKGGRSLVLSFWSGQRKEVPGIAAYPLRQTNYRQSQITIDPYPPSSERLTLYGSSLLEEGITWMSLQDSSQVSRHYSCCYVTRNTHDAKVFGIVYSDMVSCQGHAL